MISILFEYGIGFSPKFRFCPGLNISRPDNYRDCEAAALQRLFAKNQDKLSELYRNFRLNRPGTLKITSQLQAIYKPLTSQLQAGTILIFQNMSGRQSVWILSLTTMTT